MGDVFVASKERAKNGYGQNGYQGPSSATPGKPLPSMDRDFGLKIDPSAAPGDWQTRKVDETQYGASHGMKARDDKITFPTGNARPVTKPNPAKGKSDGKSFQRR